MQVAVVDDRPVIAGDDTAWSLVHEVDPGSPRLHERLRRLPAVGLPAVPLPAMSLPSMPLPSLSRPPHARGLPPLPALPAAGAAPP